MPENFELTITKKTVKTEYSQQSNPINIESVNITNTVRFTDQQKQNLTKIIAMAIQSVNNNNAGISAPQNQQPLPPAAPCV